MIVLFRNLHSGNEAKQNFTRNSFLNLNGLLVTRQIDNTSPGGGGGAPGGKFVPGSHRRCESSDISACHL